MKHSIVIFMYGISNIVYKTTNAGNGRFLSFSVPQDQLRDVIKLINPYVGLNTQIDLVGILPTIKKPYFRRGASIPVYAELITEGEISTARFSTVDEKGNRSIEEMLKILELENLTPLQPHKPQN